MDQYNKEVLGLFLGGQVLGRGLAGIDRGRYLKVGGQTGVMTNGVACAAAY